MSGHEPGFNVDTEARKDSFELTLFILFVGLAIYMVYTMFFSQGTAWEAHMWDGVIHK